MEKDRVGPTEILKSLENWIKLSEDQLAVDESEKLSAYSIALLTSMGETHAILRLSQLLASRNRTVLENVITVLLKITEEGNLDQAVAQALLRQSSNISRDWKNDRNFVVVLPLLSNILSCATSGSELQDMFVSTQCLDNLLSCLQNIDFKNFERFGDVSHLQDIDNVLILSSCFPKNVQILETIMKVVAPLVRDYLLLWNSDQVSSVISDLVLRELLFLISCLISQAGVCQNIFIECQGMAALFRILKSDKIKGFIEIEYTGKDYLRREGFVDNSKTLFFSVMNVLLNVTKNVKACEMAMNADVISTLRTYLKAANTEHQDIIISTIIKLLKTMKIDPKKHVITEIYEIVSQKGFHCFCTPIARFLKENYVNSKVTIKSRRPKGPTEFDTSEYAHQAIKDWHVEEIYSEKG